VKKTLSFLLLLVLIGTLWGCGPAMPKSFIKTSQPSWTTIELREGLEYDQAWDTVLDLIIKQFDIDKVVKDEGYILTDWTNSWSGDYLKYYRVRTTVKFSPDRTKVQLKPEAQFLTDEGKDSWVIGSDARLLATLKTDIMGTVGRTTR